MYCMKKNIICIFGQPGAGKSTLSKKLEKKQNYQHIELGKRLRLLAKNDIEANYILMNGLPINNRILSRLLMNTNIDEYNLIFDGFPRDLKQYKLLKNKFKNYNISGILLKVPQYLIKLRLSRRKECSECNFDTIIDMQYCSFCGNQLKQRNDDMDISIINKRIANYYKFTIPVIKVFSKEKPFLILNTSNQLFIQHKVLHFLSEVNVRRK